MAMTAKNDKIEVHNINSPQHVVRVDKPKYEDMKSALLTVMPKEAPGKTVAELLATLKPHLSQELFPDGAKSGWWMKCVQLDLEAKGIIIRKPTKPLRLHMA